MGLNERLLERSNSYIYYKENYNKLDKELKKKQNEITSLKNDCNKVKKDRDRLFNKYEKDYLFFDFEGILSKFYVSPIIRYPFTNEDKRCFAFMDHLAKYLRKNIDENKQPLVSVILPVFNNEPQISNTIESVFNQTYGNYELIIVDDVSGDETAAHLNPINDHNVRVFINDEKKGFS